MTATMSRFLLLLLAGKSVKAFHTQYTLQRQFPLHATVNEPDGGESFDLHVGSSRRSLLTSTASMAGAIALGAVFPADASAAVGTLPEFENTNAVIQGITVDVADRSQQENMINFLVNGFDFEVLRKRINGPVEETVSSSSDTFIANDLSSWFADFLTIS